MRKNHVGLLLIILIALAVRLALLGRQSLWYDEGVTWLLSQKPLVELIQWTAADIQPPLYYLLMWETDALFGQSEWALRFPSVIFGLLTVPLICILAHRLFPKAPPGSLASAPFLAAAFLAISPVMVYYAQEARMYTLLVFEATLAGYLLLKILHPSPFSTDIQPSITNLQSPTFNHQPLTLLYALTAAAALYTHYFAAFLLLAHALYWLFILWQRRFPKALLLSALQIFGLITLLFAPWLWILLARLGDDPSYWPGALKLDEALRQVLISFTAGETVREQTGFWLALGFLLLLGLCALLERVSESVNKRMANQGMGNKNKPAPLSSILHLPSSILYSPSSIFLLLWLCLPIALILLLSYQSPKFNPRYTLLAWPAFALLIAATLARFNVQRPTFNILRFTLYTFFYAFIVATSVFSLYNWFTDPRFSKDDFKALAQFVKERRAADETVLLSSGHMYPVWAYYYGWQGWIPLPRLERLDINRVTNLNISTEMAGALQGKGGMWLVSWQDEVIDPNGVIPFWLDRIGRRPIDAGDFQGVRLEHWRLDPDKIALLRESPIERPVMRTPLTGSDDISSVQPEGPTETGYNFANQVDLVGVTQLSDTDLALFWRPRRPLPDNLLLTFALTDPAGFNWARETFIGRPGAYLYPPSRWPVGQLVMTRQHLNWQTGTPPGLYWAEASLGQADDGSNQTETGFSGWDILDAQGRPQRRTGLIDAINVKRLVKPDNGSLSLAEQPLVDFSPIISLRRSDLAQASAEPGDRLLLKLLWQAGQFNSDDISVAFDLIDAGQHSHRVGSSLTPSRQFNLPRWQPGDIVLGQYWLNIPPETTPGPATLQVMLVNVHGVAYEKVFPFDHLEVLPTKRNFSPPTSVDMPFEANFSGQITLIGANCPANCRATPAEPVTLTLYWRADAPIETNYTIFTHLLGPNETIVANADHAPPKPTQGWVSGEIITDPVTLSLPANLPPGDYPLEIGLYNAADPALPRLPLTTGESRVILPQPLRVE